MPRGLAQRRISRIPRVDATVSDHPPGSEQTTRLRRLSFGSNPSGPGLHSFVNCRKTSTESRKGKAPECSGISFSNTNCAWRATGPHPWKRDWPFWRNGSREMNSSSWR